MKRRDSVGVLCMLLLFPFKAFSKTAESDHRIRNLPQEQTITVENPYVKDTPTIYIIGETEIEDEKPRFTKGLTINSVRITEQMLSKSVMILYPGGGGRWGYNTGFEIFRGPHFDGKGKQINPRSMVENSKVRYDPVDKVSSVGGDMNQLVLYNRRPLTPLRYKIAFPSPVKIKTLTISSNCDQIRSKGVEVTMTLFADDERKEVIAKKSIGGERGGFPVVFEDIDNSSLIFEMSARWPESTSHIGFYYTRLEAELDTGSLKLPVLEKGTNTVKIGADKDSSSQARVVFRWLKDKPSGDMVVEDFEGPSAWSGGAGRRVDLLSGSFENGFAFTGDRFARLTFPAEGNHSFSHTFSQPVDMSKANRLGMATRVVRDAPMYTILVRLRDADAGWHGWLRGLRPEERWNYQSFNIENLKRDKINAIHVYFSVTQGFSRPDKPCIYDIDTISFFKESGEEKAKTSLPEHIDNYKSPYENVKIKKRKIPPVQEWFPMGFYDGILTRNVKESVWLLDQMKRLNMNTVYVSNGTLDGRDEMPGLTGLLPMAEARGIRLVYQGTSPGALYSMGRTPVERKSYLDKEILPTASKRIPEFSGSWAIAAWSLTEEIGPEHAKELKPYYDLIRKLAPDQPPTVAHNNLKAAEVDLEVNSPSVITHDFYPFFWFPRSGPSNPGRSIPTYIGHVSSYYKACRKHNASLWMMPQSWGGYEELLDPPYYGDERGMRKPQPSEIKQQGWLAVAYGATGIMYYAAVPRDPNYSHLWEYGFVESENTRAAGELFGELKKVAPLLVRLERDYKEEGFVSTKKGKVAANSFIKRKGYTGDARYIVVASLDGFEPQEVSLNIEGGGRIYDMVNKKEITGRVDSIKLGAGEGMVLLIGKEKDYALDCRMIEEELKTYYTD